MLRKKSEGGPIWVTEMRATNDVRHRGAVLALFALVLTVLAGVGPAAAQGATGAIAATGAGQAAGSVSQYRQGSAHDGVVSGPALGSSMSRAWKRTFPGIVSYAVAGDGRVFVLTIADRLSAHGAVAYALDAATGRVQWGPVVVGDGQETPSLAYADGTLVALDEDGYVYGLDPATGARRWLTVLTGQSICTVPPAVFGGRLYIECEGIGGTLYAVAARTGKLVWTSGVMYNGAGSPAVDTTGVYVVTSGLPAYHFALDGTLLWTAVYQHSYGGATTALHRGLLWSQPTGSGGTVTTLAASDGRPGRGLSSETLVALTGDTALLVRKASDGSSHVDAVKVDSGKTVWSQPADGQIDTPAIVSGGRAYVGSATGRVFALDLVSGDVVWQGSAGSPVLGPQEWSTELRQGLSSEMDTLFVPATNTLVAFH